MLKKIAIISGILLLTIQVGLARPLGMCPATPTILKRVLEQIPPVKFSVQCRQQIEDKVATGDEAWLAIAPLVIVEPYYIDMISSLSTSLSKNPMGVLNVVNQSTILSQKVGYICEVPYSKFHEEKEKQIENINSTITLLKNLNNVPENLGPLRQRCINYFNKQLSFIKAPNGSTCPKTPEAMATLIKEDAGISLMLQGHHCVEEGLFKHVRMGETQWLALAPIVLNTPRTLLADFFEDDLFYAIPRNPGATLRIIAQYFPDKLESICDGTHFPYTYDPTDKEDDGNLSLNTNVPDAIKGLTALKLNDPKLIKVRDQCVAYLKVDTLKITNRADVDDAS